MPLRSLVLILAAGLGLAAQPAKPQGRDGRVQGAAESKEEKADAKALQSGTYLLLKSGPMTLVLERDRYSLFDSTLRILVDRAGAKQVALSDGIGRHLMEKKEGADEATYWKGILASSKWSMFRYGMDPKDLDDLKAQAEALVAEGTGKEPRPVWLDSAVQVLADLGWMAAGAAKQPGFTPIVALATSKVQKERQGSGLVLHVEDHTRGFVGLRLTVDAAGMEVGYASLAFGCADYHVKKIREGKAIRTLLSFSAAGGAEIEYETVGPWSLVPAKVYPDILKAAAACPFASVDLESARALVAQLLADGTRAPMLRNPLLKAIQADLDALAALKASAPDPVEPVVAEVKTRSAADQRALIVSFAAGSLNLGFDGDGYALVNAGKDVNVERRLSGRLVISGSLGSWTFDKKPRNASDEAFWKQVMAAPGGAALREALAPRDLADLKAQVERRLYEGMRKTPLPAWVPVAGMVWADLGRMGVKEGPADSGSAPRPACARGLFLEERKEPAPKPAPAEAAVAVPALPSPVAVLSPEEKAPAEADPWRAESSQGDRIVIRPAGYDLHLGGLRVAYLRGGSGPDAWATYSVIDREGHVHGRSVAFRARDARPAKGDDLLGALMEQHYDEFELKPLVEAWLEDGAHRMNRHLGRASLEELEGAVLDRLEALAAVDPRPADLAATFLVYMELLRFNTHLRAIDKETVD